MRSFIGVNFVGSYGKSIFYWYNIDSLLKFKESIQRRYKVPETAIKSISLENIELNDDYFNAL